MLVCMASNQQTRPGIGELAKDTAKGRIGIVMGELGGRVQIRPIGGGRETAGQLMDLHELAAKALYVLIFLHVAGALKHHFIDRDNVLHRMIPLIPRRP